MKTKLNAKKMEFICRNIGFGSCLVVGSAGRSGGLALDWKEDKDITIRSYSNFHIDSFIGDPQQGDQWHFTGFYGRSELSKRLCS